MGQDDKQSQVLEEQWQLHNWEQYLYGKHCEYALEFLSHISLPLTHPVQNELRAEK